MSRKEREKRAAAEGISGLSSSGAASDAPFAEARCFVIAAGHEYKRRERATGAAIVLHAGAPGAPHPCVTWAPAAEALFARCAAPAALAARRFHRACTAQHAAGSVRSRAHAHARCWQRADAPLRRFRHAAATALAPARRSGHARALYIFDYSDFAADWPAELASPHLGRCAKPLARLFAKLNPEGAHLAAAAPAAPLALKLLPGAPPQLA
jgi:hypothetical protein